LKDTNHEIVYIEEGHKNTTIEHNIENPKNDSFNKEDVNK